MRKEYKVFDLREFKDSTEAFRERKDWIHCYDDEQDEYLPHILIFSQGAEELTEFTYGPDNNYTDYNYQPLNLTMDEVIKYLKEAE